MIEKEIPSYFYLFGSRVDIVWNNEKMNDKERYGECSYSTCKITLSTHHGVLKLSDDKIKDCLYHEKVHMILDFMQEYDLSTNEKFVDTFAKLLRQSDITAVYPEPYTGQFPISYNVVTSPTL
jgi:hypothetical protein